jgi:hypothetical protein
VHLDQEDYAWRSTATAQQSGAQLEIVTVVTVVTVEIVMCSLHKNNLSRRALKEVAAAVENTQITSYRTSE